MEFLGKRFQQIKELALKEDCDHFKSLAYITEEVGELAQDIIDGELEHGRLESLDVVLASVAMFYKLGGTNEELDSRLKRNIRKYKRSLKNE